MVFGEDLIKAKKNTKNKKRPADPRSIYQNKLDETFYQHGEFYTDFKDLYRRIASL